MSKSGSRNELVTSAGEGSRPWVVRVRTDDGFKEFSALGPKKDGAARFALALWVKETGRSPTEAVSVEVFSRSSDGTSLPKTTYVNPYHTLETLKDFPDFSET